MSLAHRRDGSPPTLEAPRCNRETAPLAAVPLLAGAGAAAWAVTRNDPSASTTIECGTDTFIPVESGNPILDCHNALARQESVVPPLAGWITPTGLVAVLPTGEAPPPGSTPLPAAFAVDRSILYVGDVLDDEAQPIATTCTTSGAAAAFARAQLQLADLPGWSVQVRSSTGSSGPCVGYSGFLDTSSHAAVLVPTPPSSASRLDVRLDERPRTQLVSGPSASCDTSSQAVALVGSDARQLGLAPSDYAVSVASTIGSAATTCALVTIDPGGSIQANVWQVPSGS